MTLSLFQRFTEKKWSEFTLFGKIRMIWFGPPTIICWMSAPVFFVIALITWSGKYAEDGGMAVLVGYIGLFFVGAVYASIGTFASSLFDNQVVAFIIGVFIVLMFFLFDKLLIFVPSFLAGTIQYISVDYHFSNISRGVIDSRNLIYFLSVIGVFLFATVQVLNSRKWK